ncbi:DUF4226 domain-containing protein [Nocardia spumae]|uniref:DUF4226 domain-containing protein n=1 Tax=Nocardia spumae TaxID=2887190 RepID=UPI001D1526CC|nr:DUF4226 domain-containing protein [Nocardia spumae]
MTSAEVWQATEPDDTQEPAPFEIGTDERQSGRTTPWTKATGRNRGPSGAPIPGSPATSDTATASDTAAPVANPVRHDTAADRPATTTAAPISAPAASSSPWTAARSAPDRTAAPTAAPTNSAAPAATTPVAAPAAAPQTTAGTVDTGHDDGAGLMDPSALASAAMPAMTMLPMLASALAGLGKGRTGSGAPQSGADGSGSGALTPEAQRALDTLRQLKDTYGDENKNPSDPETDTGKKRLDTGTGTKTRGSGQTTAQVRARQMYQRTAAAAFNTLDNDLVDFMRRHAGKHKLDKKAVTQLLRDVDTQLAELGSAAYTKAGQLQVHRILTKALEQATRIVGGGSVTSKDAAAEINRLTKQYMYNLAGQRLSSGSAGGSGSGTTVGGTVGQWIQQALGVLAAAGVDTSRIDPEAIAIIIQHESGGNPSATNNWDSNAASGTPSIGLMQTIGPTFNSYALSGHRNIYNPVDNIVAGVRYAISRYGSVSNVPGVVAVRSGRAYRGY